MNGRWIDQFPPEREYDLEIDEDTYELQMADAAAAQAAANSAAESARRAEEIAQGLREEIPTKVSELENDSNYAVDANYVHTDNNFTSSEKNKLEGIAAGAEVNVNADWNATSGDAFILNKPTKVSDFDNDVGYLTEHQDISGKANAADLAAVATSGSYNDLLNKPSIPNKVSDLTDDSGHYTKPTNGIPASDLEETYLTEHQDISGKADKSEIPTAVSQLDNDAGYITGYTETDPTVPAWAKASTKPSYTASEVGAPTVQEMNTAINNAIGNVNSFDVAVVQTLPSENISTHTIYLVPKTGETNDVYDEYIYINNAWEMVGNTQIDLSDYATKSEIPDVPVEDVQINGSSIINNGVANIPVASEANFGLVKAKVYVPNHTSDDGSVYLLNDTLYVVGARTSRVKAGGDFTAAIAAGNQHQSTFYGLAKAAGADEKNSSLPVGQYTDGAKAAIQNMLNVPDKSDIPSVPVQDVQVNGSSIVDNGVANVPVANETNLGLVKAKVYVPNTTDDGSVYLLNDTLYVVGARTSRVKAGGDFTAAIAAGNQHQSTFYGLAKIAGYDEKNSNLPAGQYTENAKSAIHEMLNGPVEVTGTTPVITALPGISYKCGEVSTLDVTLPASGCIDVIFESGSTPTVLTVTPPTGVTLRWANGFDPNNLEANTMYEINILDGLGVAMTWT